MSILEKCTIIFFFFFFLTCIRLRRYAPSLADYFIVSSAGVGFLLWVTKNFVLLNFFLMRVFYSFLYSITISFKLKMSPNSSLTSSFHFLSNLLRPLIAQISHCMQLFLIQIAGFSIQNPDIVFFCTCRWTVEIQYLCSELTRHQSSQILKVECYDLNNGLQPRR